MKCEKCKEPICNNSDACRLVNKTYISVSGSKMKKMCQHCSSVLQEVDLYETFDIYDALRMCVSNKIEMETVDGKSRLMCSENPRKWWVDGQIADSDGLIMWTYGAIASIWQKYKEKPKTFGWDEAYRLMKEGKKVARLLWDNKKYCIGIYDGKFKKSDADWNELISPEDLDATDWYIYEE